MSVNFPFSRGNSPFLVLIFLILVLISTCSMEISFFCVNFPFSRGNSLFLELIFLILVLISTFSKGISVF